MGFQNVLVWEDFRVQETLKVQEKTQFHGGKDYEL